MKNRYRSLQRSATLLKIIAAVVIVFGTLGAFLVARPLPPIRYSFDIASFLVLEIGLLITALLLNTTSDVIPLLITIEENTRANAAMTKRLLARQQPVKKLTDDSEWPTDIGS